MNGILHPRCASTLALAVGLLTAGTAASQGMPSGQLTAAVSTCSESLSPIMQSRLAAAQAGDPVALRDVVVDLLYNTETLWWWINDDVLGCRAASSPPAECGPLTGFFDNEVAGMTDLAAILAQTAPEDCGEVLAENEAVLLDIIEYMVAPEPVLPGAMVTLAWNSDVAPVLQALVARLQQP